MLPNSELTPCRPNYHPADAQGAQSGHRPEGTDVKEDAHQLLSMSTFLEIAGRAGGLLTRAFHVTAAAETG
jgi:hypothetical protein